jgi:hypothetical protein
MLYNVYVNFIRSLSMKMGFRFAAALAAAMMLSQPAEAQNAIGAGGCQTDLATFCSGAGANRLTALRCLADHSQSLSPGCQAAITSMKRNTTRSQDKGGMLADRIKARRDARIASTNGMVGPHSGQIKKPVQPVYASPPAPGNATPGTTHPKSGSSVPATASPQSAGAPAGTPAQGTGQISTPSASAAPGTATPQTGR